MIRALVADDEEPARRRLIRHLHALGGLEVVSEATDGADAFSQAQVLRPDVLFLDVRMPELDGIELAKRGSALPPIIFTTAYDEFAVRAFEAEAVDYLLKPILTARLAAAVERVRQMCRSEAPRLATAQPLAAGLATASVPRVTARWRDALHLFDAREVARFYALDKYTAFQVGSKEQLTQESLCSLEQRLQGHGFLRVHRGELVNLALVRVLHDSECGYELEFSDGQRSRVSRRHAGVLRAVLGIG